MRLLINIPKEFEQHFQADRFEDSLHRLRADVHLMAGLYEQETAEMLIEAFKNAVLVPPHGRLIDADALSKSLDDLCDRVCQYSKAQRKVMCSACPLGDAFAVVEDDAPTIIESEEDETWD